MKQTQGKATGQNTGSPWTIAEIQFLEKHYLTMPPDEIARRLRRTPGAIYRMALKLGCSHPGRFWTAEEYDTLRRCCENGMRVKAMLPLLPERSQCAILSMMTKLGLVSRRWLPDELAVLKNHFATEGVNVIHRLPGRSESAIRNQAALLGLRHQSARHMSRWSAHELALLEKHQHLPLAELCRLFTGRSSQSVCRARMRLSRRTAVKKT